MGDQYLYVKEMSGKLFIKELKNGNRVHTITDEGPFCLFESKKDGEFRTHLGKPATPHFFKRIGDIKDYSDMVSGTANYGLSGMRELGYQYIAHCYSDRSGFDADAFNTMFFDIETARDSEKGYAPVDNPFNPVTLIQVEYRKKKIVWGMMDYKGDKADEFRHFYDELEMIKDFFKWVKLEAIDIVSGWNIEYYDIPYLMGRLLGQYDRNNPRAEHIKERGYWTKKDLFAFGKVRKYTKRGMFGKDEVRYEIMGLIALDYLDLYKKFTYKTPPDYKLNTIANIELGDTKVDYSEVKHLEELYHTNYTKFVDYGIKDAQLVRRLDDKLQLINLGITLAYLTGINVNDVYSPVKMWEVYLYNEMLKDKIVPPWKRTNNKRDSFVGAFVKDPLKGKHKWVMSFDLNSLYPHIMMGINMSPDTHVPYERQHPEIQELYGKHNEHVEKSIAMLVEGKSDLSLLKKHNLSMSPNGGMFRRDVQGVIPKILENVYAERSATKKTMLVKEQEKEDTKDPKLDAIIAQLNAKQMALKIAINALYGACGNPYFKFYNLDVAEGITSMGQVAIKFIANKVNGYLSNMLDIEKDRIVLVDTDSIYCSMEDFVDRLLEKNPNLTDVQITDILDKVGEEMFQPFIDESYQELADYLNSYQQKMVMKREKIASSIISVAKKRYLMAVIDSEGVRYKKPKVKVTGVESVRSTTPQIARDALVKVFECMLKEDKPDSTLSKMAEFRSEFMVSPLMEIAIPKGVNGIEKWSKDGFPIKGTPQQVKAALLYNRMILEKDPLAEIIKSGDKVKLLTLKSNPKFGGENCLGIPQIIPEELDFCEADVDKQEMFQKVYVKPLNTILEKINWPTYTGSAVSVASFF